MSDFYHKHQCEIEPPWIKYPEFPPGDSFWRQSGELWFVYVWLPYWKSLCPKEQDFYLKRWKIPTEWHFCEYVNPNFKKWLNSIDE